MRLSLKKLLIGAIFSLSFLMLLFTSPYVYAGEGISTEIKKYHYENDDIYYSDGYFAHSAKEYDSHLASLSMLMTKYSMNPGNPSSLSDTNWYLNQSNRVKGFFELIGFDSFLANDDYKSRSGFDTIGVGACKRQVGDYTLIGVTVRSGGYFREWASNVYIGDGKNTDYMHEGFYNASLKLISHLQKYIDQYAISGKIKVWVSGYSRGGAVTNLASGIIDNYINDGKKLNSNVSITHDDLYAYTFEAPQGANINSKNVKYPKDEIYNNIHNIVNPNDLVTKVAMNGYGFTRFGVDKFITTKLYDSGNFEANRSVFKKLYKEFGNDETKYSADKLNMVGISGGKIAAVLASGIGGGIGAAAISGYLIQKISGFITPDDTKANYDSNIVADIVLDELVKQLGSRDKFYKEYQSLVKDLMLAIMSDDKTDMKAKIVNLVADVLLETMIKYFGVSGSALKKIYNTGDTSKAIDNVASLIGVLVKVYTERPNEVLSLLMGISDVFMNHDTNVSVCHVECQDSYYINAYNEKHPDDKINLVNLRENADLVHMSFYGYNDLAVTNSNKKEIIKVDGHVFGKSDVKKCDQSCAVGYYSYATEEKMELFLPINQYYEVSFKSYSKKLRHLVAYDTKFESISATNQKHNLPHDSDHTWFNSNRTTLIFNYKF